MAIEIFGDIGTISHGTLRTPHLMDAFADELERLVKANVRADAADVDFDDASNLIKSAREWLDDESDGAADDDDNSAWIMEKLYEALDELAPPLCYFGAHEGDGSDFGFWPCMDYETPRLEAGASEAELIEAADGAGVSFVFTVNDHGNVDCVEIIRTTRVVWSMV